ncbi:MAG: hypothetical protein C4539_10715 [Ignavibacteriales bacterium]|nr:MAG: hypothetical protein C4539_10715 [Ignavibacteriales bacterium]
MVIQIVKPNHCEGGEGHCQIVKLIHCLIINSHFISRIYKPLAQANTVSIKQFTIENSKFRIDLNNAAASLDKKK